MTAAPPRRRSRFRTTEAARAAQAEYRRRALAGRQVWPCEASRSVPQRLIDLGLIAESERDDRTAIGLVLGEIAEQVLGIKDE